MAEIELLTSKEVADILGVTRQTIDRYADNGDIACFRLPGGHRRFRRADIDALIAAGTTANEERLA